MTTTTKRITIALIAAGALSAGCSSGKPAAREPEQNAVQTRQLDRARAVELFNKATALHRDGDLSGALLTYRDSIEADNTFYAAWNNMGQLLMEQKNYADAVSAYRVASDLQPSDPRPEYNIGLAYQTIGWGDESYKHFELALLRDPNYLPAIRGAVRSAEMLGMGTQTVLGYIRTGMLRETDEQWRTYFERQRFRVEKLIEEQG